MQSMQFFQLEKTHNGYPALAQNCCPMTQMPKTTPTLLPLAYMEDSAAYFHTIASQLPMALILQSDSQFSTTAITTSNMRGRFDVISAQPAYWLESGQGGCRWHGDAAPMIALDGLDSFTCLHQLLDIIQQGDTDFSNCISAELPFCGGLIGYCSYDLAREYIAVGNSATRDIDMPDMQFGFYTWACIQDHQHQQSWLVLHPDCAAGLRDLLPSLLQAPAAPPVTGKHLHKGTIASSLTRSDYDERFGKIQEYIVSGDCYQVNFSQRFSANIDAPGSDLYLRMRQVMPSPFSAFLPVLGSVGEDAIISLSPERFVQLGMDRVVKTQPIKGTTPRSPDPQTDQNNARRLKQDPKNRAENLMIVDLLRNDLGRVCQVGSIRVTDLFELQSFANVHHLVSTISGTLADGLNAADLLKACFPGGSITGAPKIRAMEIIEELEPYRRSIYCGTIAMFSTHGTMDSSICIRTMLLKDGTIHCWGGGGIVADSTADSEYAEAITKIQSLLDTLSRQQ